MRLSRLAGVLAVVALTACNASKQQEEPQSKQESQSKQEPQPDFRALKDATVTLFPGHCAGVVVADGRHALTAAHCIDVATGERQPVVLRDGHMLSGVVKVVDPIRDLAVIRFDTAAPVHPLAVAASMPIPGEELLFAGRNDRPSEPQEVELRKLGRCPSLPGVPQALFTSLHGEKGDSGAPVVDLHLQVVGLVHGGAACSIAAPTAGFVPVLNTLVAEAARPDSEQGVGGSGGAGQ
ncbi:serine protease [Vitiosangium sp. GDMCC 1.1324]|uniref:S1 family peptidase n=1 Tax=Vitiosangium sp. (strain GDMCC 1.1324) TaxID=2138576 RepID=UPI000D38BD3F|nr:serine protease [Vitiosangium sp. GDMCC 1.1324]PTL84299.1 serine protease [Vitiosangium sp. GDMCC 1.1324]